MKFPTQKPILRVIFSLWFSLVPSIAFAQTILNSEENFTVVAQATKLGITANEWRDRKRLFSMNEEMNQVIMLATKLRDDPNLYLITGMWGMLPNMPGGVAANLAAKLRTLKNNLALGEMQAKWNTSPAKDELDIIFHDKNSLMIGTFRLLDTGVRASAEVFRKQLNLAVVYFSRLQFRMHQIYIEQYGSLPSTLR